MIRRHDPSPPDDAPPRAAAPGGRREPSLGRIGDIEALEIRQAREVRTPARGPRLPAARRRWAWGLGLAIVLAGTALALFRQPIADRLWPETRALALQAEAAEALARNHLSAGDGSGARELYEAALAIDPDRNEARRGLMQVAEAALAQSRAALARDHFEQAHRYLRLARELSIPTAQADVVAEALRKREAALAGIDGLFTRAEAARQAGRLLDGEDAALPLYQRVLALQPDHDDALRGREDALADLLEQARGALRAGDLRAAATRIALARRYDPGHVDLPDSEARLTEETEVLRRRTEADLRRGRLQQAAQGYRSLLALSPDDAAAAQGLASVASAHARRAERLAADFEFEAAEAALDAARALEPEAAGVRDAERHLVRARQSRARLAPAILPRERDRRVRALLEEAAAAEARGDLLTPPGDSAFDKLRAARALAPRDAAVGAASARLLSAATACFERGLRGNDLGRARACLDARSALSDDDGAVREARRRLAQRWLAVGDERLAAGELQSAGAALAAARSNDPSLPGIVEFAERLRTATASGN